MFKVENHHNLVDAFGPSRSSSPIYIIANLQIIYFEDFPKNSSKFSNYDALFFYFVRLIQTVAR